MSNVGGATDTAPQTWRDMHLNPLESLALEPLPWRALKQQGSGVPCCPGNCGSRTPAGLWRSAIQVDRDCTLLGRAIAGG